MNEHRSSRPPEAKLLLRLFRGWRIALARLLGITGETRAATVRAMIERHGNDRIAYWFQLVLSMGIATFGLVLGSTGVVIGAMLVSPLMGPIIETGMGLVTGSPVLVLYAAVRTAASVVVVVAGSALLSFGVPYHELNGEILARTSPTLIDLYVASFCALAAAYTTVRQSSDTISAAAGTAISIALVPPLCVVGWGFGSAHLEVSRGAALLFTANLCAILLFAVVAFFLLAYDVVDASSLEQEATEGSATLHRFAVALRRGFGSKYGPVLRLGMPMVLVIAIYVPLRHALEEVAWKVRVRDQVDRTLSEIPAAKGAVRTSVNVDRRTLSVRLVIIGDPKDATKLKTELTSRITAAAGVEPTIDVVALPDLAAVRAATQASPQGVITRTNPTLPEIRRNLDEEIRQRWPTATAGELASWSLVIPHDGVATIQVNHFGAALGGSGEALLTAILREQAGIEIVLRDVPLPTGTVTLTPNDEIGWAEETREHGGLRVARGRRVRVRDRATAGAQRIAPWLSASARATQALERRPPPWCGGSRAESPLHRAEARRSRPGLWRARRDEPMPRAACRRGRRR